MTSLSHPSPVRTANWHKRFPYGASGRRRGWATAEILTHAVHNDTLKSFCGRNAADWWKSEADAKVTCAKCLKLLNAHEQLEAVARAIYESEFLDDFPTNKNGIEYALQIQKAQAAITAYLKSVEAVS